MSLLAVSSVVVAGPPWNDLSATAVYPCWRRAAVGVGQDAPMWL